MHPDLEKMRVRGVPWSTMNPRDKGPRWVLVAVDNVAAGWSDISDEPNVEGYFSTYLFDAWKVYRYCSPQKMFQLYGCGNHVWVKDGTDEDERENIYNDWEVGVSVADPMVNVDDMERPGSPWVVLETYPDDGECEDDDERQYHKYVDELIEGVMRSPPLLATTAEAARVHDPAWLLRHHGAKENHMKIKKLIKKTLAPLLAEVGFVPARTRRRSSNRGVRFSDVVGPWLDMTGNGMSESAVRNAVKRAKDQAEALYEGGPAQSRMAERIEEQVLRVCCEHVATKGYDALAQSEVWEAKVGATFDSRTSYFEFLRKLSQEFEVVDNFYEDCDAVKGRVFAHVTTARRADFHAMVLAECVNPRISFSLKEYRV